MNRRFDALTDEVVLRINELCNRFEQQWNTERRLSIELLLRELNDADQPAQEALLAELIGLEADLRREAGEAIDASEYADRFPQADRSIVDQCVTIVAAGPDRSAPTGTPSENFPTLDTTAEVASPGRAGTSVAAEEAAVTRQRHSLNDVNGQLVEAGILSDRELTEFLDRLSEDERPNDAASMVGLLHERERLTDYQANVLRGEESGFLQLGEYTLLERIGGGGMGSVFKAVHRRMRRRVAIKLLRRDFRSNEDFIRRFEREVQVAARLLHPNIVTAHDAGEHDGLPYLVMEYVEGIDLSRHVRDNGPLSPGEAVRAIVQAARGLEYAHQQGVIHRDVKPGNLLIDDSGHVKVLDVGLSRLNESDASDSGGTEVTELTTTGVVMGTVDFMAPEQARNTRLADERSDIYSLGCTLYFLLTGRHCYDGETQIERLLAHREQPVPALTSPYGHLPDELQTAFERAVAKEPGDRFQNMGRFASELEAVRKKLPAEPDLVEDAWKEPETSDSLFSQTTEVVADKKDTPLLTIAMTGVTVALLSWLGYFLFLSDSDDDQRNDTENAVGPALLTVPFGPESASEHQRLSAEYYGVGVSLSDDQIGVEFVLIPPGSYTMGTARSELRALMAGEPLARREQIRSEAPQNGVTISRAFYLGRTEITRGRFRMFCEADEYETEVELSQGGWGRRDGRWLRSPEFSWRFIGDEIELTDDHPAVNLTWNDAAAFVDWANTLEPGVVYRLPTEAEWEYACRAGHEEYWSWGNEPEQAGDFSWFQGNSGNQPHPVGAHKPNAFGLYDMHGNESEWCRDVYLDVAYVRRPSSDPFIGPARGWVPLRVRRGGSFLDPPSSIRSNARVGQDPGNPTGGSFRLVREIPEPVAD